MFVELWVIAVLHVGFIGSLWYSHYERRKRKQLAKLIVKLRQKEPLTPEELVLYHLAPKSNLLEFEPGA